MKKIIMAYGVFISAAAVLLCACSAMSPAKTSGDTTAAGNKAAPAQVQSMKQTEAAAYAMSRTIPAETRVLTGLDILERDGFRQIAGKRIGLITNHSSVNMKGENAADVLWRAKKIKLVKIFSPEHGFRGIENEGVRIESSTDTATGLPVISLYGRNRLRPTQEMLKDIDVLVFDIQDIGARFYTYLTTMGYAMEEAARAGIDFVVLDRPNPIGGITEGPVLEDGISLFTAYYRVPARHGLTAGEMALFHKSRAAEGSPLARLNLRIIKMENWNRNIFFNETGIKWTDPSPNIREPAAEVLYPGIGCFEASNLSVGRGTDIPFLWFGAPWLDGSKLAAQLNADILPGVSFTELSLTPDRSVHKGIKCGGVKITVTDQKAVRALDMLVYISWHLKKNHPADFRFREKEIRDMTGTSALYDMLEAGAGPEEILKIYRQSSAQFKADTADIRLYR